jgi:ADP-heptose:LPS heptosyltransferase
MVPGHDDDGDIWVERAWERPMDDVNPLTTFFQSFYTGEKRIEPPVGAATILYLEDIVAHLPAPPPKPETVKRTRSLFFFKKKQQQPKAAAADEDKKEPQEDAPKKEEPQEREQRPRSMMKRGQWKSVIGFGSRIGNPAKGDTTTA